MDVATDETQYVNCDNIVQHVTVVLCNATCLMFGNTPTKIEARQNYVMATEGNSPAAFSDGDSWSRQSVPI